MISHKVRKSYFMEKKNIFKKIYFFISKPWARLQFYYLDVSPISIKTEGRVVGWGTNFQLITVDCRRFFSSNVCFCVFVFIFILFFAVTPNIICSMDILTHN